MAHSSPILLFHTASTRFIVLLGLVFLIRSATADPFDTQVFSTTREYPLPNPGNIAAHDPNILEHKKNFYLFKGGIHLPIFRAPSLDGPWEKLGTVLDGPSIIQKGNRRRPWAPTTIEWNGRFYCFYAISRRGKRNSAIGVASSDSLEPGGWTDHGSLINTGTGPRSGLYPFNVSNAIDASFIVDYQAGEPYLLYGSYWDGIFQLALADHLLSIKRPRNPDVNHLVYLPGPTRKPQEGSFMSYSRPYYYLWFSYGKCCEFEPGFPSKGEEYSIRVGRSTSIRGPFLDKDDRSLLKGGGTTVYGSNHGIVYAPGGIGVLPATIDHPDIMYYHYLNTSIGFGHSDAHLGWNYIDYVDGWPVPRPPENHGSGLRPSWSLKRLFVLLCMCCLATVLFYKGFLGRNMMIPTVFLIAWTLVWFFHASTALDS